MLLACVLTRLFRSRARLEAEILVLRHQLNILQRKSTERASFKSIDRLVFAGLYRLVPGVLDALKILKPETVIRWPRAGYRAYAWKSRSRGGRPKTPLEVRQLIRDMSIENPLWGAPRIHGELLKLGIDVGQTTVAKYMARGRRPPSQGWKTFLPKITRTASRRWICSWSPRSRSGCCMDFWSCGIPAVRILVAGRDRASERPMDCASTLRGLRLATGAAIYRSRSGLCLWRCLYPSRSRDEHSGPADGTTIAMAERTCGEAHRFDPTGLP